MVRFEKDRGRKNRDKLEAVSCSSLSNPEDPAGRIRKNSLEIYVYLSGVASIFPHTYIHFPSTSSLRYIVRIESMSVTRNLHFPGKYRGGKEEQRPMWTGLDVGWRETATRGGGGGWNIQRLEETGTLATSERVGNSERRFLTGQTYQPERFSRGNEHWQAGN